MLLTATMAQMQNTAIIPHYKAVLMEFRIPVWLVSRWLFHGSYFKLPLHELQETYQ